MKAMVLEKFNTNLIMQEVEKKGVKPLDQILSGYQFNMN